MPTLYESEFDAQMEREFRPWKCFGIFLLRCLILFAELCILTALLYWANHTAGVASWLRISTAIALFLWGGFAWNALNALANAWVRTRFVRLTAKLFIVLTLILLFNVAMQITYPV